MIIFIKEKLRIVYIILIMSSLLSFVSCCKVENKAEVFDKVIILYLAANNNLSSFAQDNISALNQGYIPSLDSKQALVVFSHLQGTAPKLIRLYKDKAGSVKEELLTQYPDQNSAKAENLKEVLNNVKEKYNSLEYGLILWSHATGWLPVGYYQSNPARMAYLEDPYWHLVKSFGEDRGSEIQITDLNSALPYKFSFILFDCCFMGGIESIYELKDKADYIIASPTEILATGFPYNKIMQPLFESKSDLNQTCQLFYDFYTSPGELNYATISIYKTDKLAALADVTKSIFTNNRHKISSLEMSTIQPYFRLSKNWFYDFDDFITQIATTQELISFRLALNDVVVGKWFTPRFLDINIKKYSGVSSYVPNPQDEYLDYYYKGYSWNRAVGMVQ